MNSIDPLRAASVARHYNRIARAYDFLEAAMERAFRPWRERLWSRLHGGSILEVGVGTGKNLPYHCTARTSTAARRKTRPPPDLK